MDRVTDLIKDQMHRHLMPAHIHVVIPKYIATYHLASVRIFLKALRKAQQDYFVRFSTSLLWVMESDNSDAFYSRENKFVGHRDATFALNIFNSSTIEITVGIPFESKQNLILQELSRDLLAIVKAPKIPHSRNALFNTIDLFSKKTNMTEQVNGLVDDFHVLFIPNVRSDYYIPIPIWGISPADAKRRYLSAKKTFTFLSDKHRYLPLAQPSPTDILELLVRSIQDQEESRKRTLNAKDTYALAELLFGHYLTHCAQPDREDSRHELILFNCIDTDEEESVDIYNMRMKDRSY